MPKYRVFRQNPITTEWVDRGWQEGTGQDDALRQIATDGDWHFVVPESSFHPIRKGSRTIALWERLGDGEEFEAVAEGASSAPEE